MGELLQEHISTEHGEKVEVIHDPSQLVLPRMPEFGHEANVPELVLGFFREFWETNGFSTDTHNHFEVLAIANPKDNSALLLANRYVGTPESASTGHGATRSSTGWASLGVETYSITHAPTPTDEQQRARARVTASADLLITKTHVAPRSQVLPTSAPSPLPEQPWLQPRFRDRSTYLHWQGQRLDRYKFWSQWLYRDAWQKRLGRELGPIADR